MIIQNLLRRKGRTIMCIVAIAISTALLVSLLSVAEGIWQNAQFAILSSHEDIIIKPSVPSGGVFPVLNNGHSIADELKMDTTNISEVSPMTLWPLEFYVDNDNSSDIQDSPKNTNNQVQTESGIVLSIGVIPERLKKFFTDENTYNLDIVKFEFDHWFETPDDPHYENNFTGPWTYELLIDDHMAKNYNLQRGSKVKLSIDRVQVTFSVTGIFKTNLMGGYYEDYVDGLVILHLSELQSLLGHDVIELENQTIILDNVETLAISLKSSRPKNNEPSDIAFSIKERYPLLDVLTKEEQLKRLEEQNTMSNMFYTAISIVAVIIGLLFVACIMLISVYERINEIGTLRAIGISRFTIFKWVMLESLLLIMLGVLIGFLPGYFGSKLLGEYLSQSIGISQELTAFSPKLVLNSFIGMLILGSLVSLIPAIRASYMRVASAISFVR